MSKSECPSCLGTNVVRNGKVRGHQRYKCHFCQKNFVFEFAHRWPNESRFLNLLLLASGESRDEVAKGCQATPETVSRWLSDAKDQKDWFIEALANGVNYAVVEKSESLEDALEDTVKLYCLVTEDTSELGVSRIAQKLRELLELRRQSAKFDGSQ
ncbi:MAG: IS1 family transposase [Hyphomicrobiales bacterium]